MISSRNVLIFLLATLTLMMFSFEAIAKVKAVNFVAGVIRKHDSNIYRTDKDRESDNITSLQLGLKLDKEISLQRFTAKAIVTHNRYSDNDDLDFTSKEFEAAWHWALTPRLTGKLSADRSERLNNFNDTQNRERNVRIEQNQTFLADFNPFGGWHYLAGVSRSTLDNSRTFTEDTSFTEKALDFGVKYVFPSQSSITFMNHARKGKYDERRFDQARLFDDKYKEYETGLEVDWLLTVKSKIKVGASYLKRKHDNFSKRDYSGFQALAAYDWDPTQRINVQLAAKSELDSYQTDVDSYTRKNTLTLAPSYRLTPKTRFKGILEVSERDFSGSGYNPQTASSRSDDYKRIGVAAEWKPTQKSAVELSLSRYDLNSNDNRFDYKGNAAWLSGRIEF